MQKRTTMSKMRNLIIGFGLMLCAGKVSAQQLPYFSQYMFNAYAINPAVAGSQPGIEANVSFRSQWTGFNDAPRTQVMSAHGQITENMGVGGIIFSDRTGPIVRSGVQLSYAYHLEISDKDKLAFGLSGMLFQHVLKKDMLVFDQPDDNALYGTDESRVYPEAQFGMYYYGENYYGGFSSPQLFQKKISFGNDTDNKDYNMARHYFLNGGYIFDLDAEWSVEPSILFKAVAGAPVQVDFNVKALYRKTVWGAISYRHKESIVIMTGLQYEQVRIGYSYDLTLTNIKKHSTGSHELFLGMNIPIGGSGATRSRIN